MREEQAADLLFLLRSWVEALRRWPKLERIDGFDFSRRDSCRALSDCLQYYLREGKRLRKQVDRTLLAEVLEILKDLGRKSNIKWFLYEGGGGSDEMYRAWTEIDLFLDSVPRWLKMEA
ncbi:unnamed protein product [Amoebophrya sp. A25]|nr:unnamed protein product [Amoebophrya sp. A25]|eukprot:GSA25T00016766001.1